MNHVQQAEINLLTDFSLFIHFVSNQQTSELIKALMCAVKSLSVGGEALSLLTLQVCDAADSLSPRQLSAPHSGLYTSYKSCQTGNKKPFVEVLTLKIRK